MNVEHLTTLEMWMDSVSKNGSLIKYTPEHFKTPELCAAAVENDPSVVSLIPQTQEIYNAIIPRPGVKIPKKFRTPDITWKQAMYLTTDNDINTMSKENITPELCWKSVKYDGAMIFYVPEEYLTQELLDEAVIVKPPSRGTYPIIYMTAEMCMPAVSRKGELLKYVPKQIHTPELCNAAIYNYPLAIQWATRTQELCENAVKLNPKAIVDVDLEFKTQEMCDNLELFEGVGNHIPLKFMTPELKKKIDDYYESKGYKTYGNIKIRESERYVDEYTANNSVILEDGSRVLKTSIQVHDLIDERV